MQTTISAETRTSEDFAKQLSTSPDWPALWRQFMPVAERFAYFDHAAVGPLSAPACSAIQKYASQAMHLGDTVWPTWNRNLDRVRHLAAELAGCEEREIAIVANTTSGIGVVAEGFPWKEGDNVVIPSGEFPSNLFPWKRLEVDEPNRPAVEVRVVPRQGDRVNVGDLLDACDQRTRLIATSWVGYASGFRIDVDSLVAQAHQRGILVFIDAIQGLGVMPLDLGKTPVDFLAADGHKWLLGPEGAGILFVRQKHIDLLRPPALGWASVKASHNYSDPVMELKDDAGRFESGSANMPGIAALAASLEMFAAVGRNYGADSVSRRILDLCEQLDDRLKSLGAKTRRDASQMHQSGIVSFEIPGKDPAKVREEGLRQDVVLSVRDGSIRAAVHAYQNDEDFERLIEICKA
ncbi:MAG: aminotransferase class V-fold PLP-dependent enzyme [Planctomycetota bacterium]